MQYRVITDYVIKMSKYIFNVVNQVTDHWYVEFFNLILISIRFSIDFWGPILLDDPLIKLIAA